MENKLIFDILKDVYSSTDVGKVREQNQDSIGYLNSLNGDIFVVCDGMGGHVGGETASSTAVDSIMEYMSSELFPEIKTAMADAIKYAHEKVRQKAQEMPELKGMGTTVVMLVIKEEKAYIAHVGDSRIYFLSDNKLHRITKDQSYVQMLIDQKIISEEESESHPRKSELLQAIGTKPTVEPDIAEQAILPKNGDIFLLCSDGLSGMVNDLTIQATIKNTEKPIQERGDELLQLALNAGARDNVSIQLIQISNSNNTQSVFVDKSNAAILTNTQYDEIINPDNTKTIIEEDSEQINSQNDFDTQYDTQINNFDTEKPKSFLDKIMKYKIVIILVILAAIAVLYFMQPTKKQYEVYLLNDSTKIYELIKEFPDTNQAVNFLKTETESKKTSGFISFKNISSDTLKIKTEQLIEHIVKQGDSWDILYNLYGVCYCYIKIENNKSNTYIPEINDKLIIPTQYSGLQKYNEQNFKEYSTKIVGENCKNLDPNGNLIISEEPEPENNNNVNPPKPENNNQIEEARETVKIDSPKVINNTETTPIKPDTANNKQADNI